MSEASVACSAAPRPNAVRTLQYQCHNHAVLQQREAACWELAFVTADEGAWAVTDYVQQQLRT